MSYKKIKTISLRKEIISLETLAMSLITGSFGIFVTIIYLIFS